MLVAQQDKPKEIETPLNNERKINFINFKQSATLKKKTMLCYNIFFSITVRKKCQNRDFDIQGENFCFQPAIADIFFTHFEKKKKKSQYLISISIL